MTARKLFTAAMMVFMAACTDGGGGTGPESGPGFTADEAAYQPYSAATVYLNGGAPAAGTVVPGTLGSAAVSLVSSSDSSLTFMVPAAAGVQTLKFDLGGRTYSGAITVTAAQNVANAETFLESVADVADEGVNAAAAAFAGQPMPGDSAVAVEMLQEARDSLASFRRLMAQMTPAERQEVANILNANLSPEHRALVLGVAAGTMHASSYPIPAVCAAKNTALEQYQCTWGEFFKTMKSVAKYFGAAAIAAKTMPATGLAGLAVAAVSTAFGLVHAVDAVWQGAELVKIHGLLAMAIGVATVDATKDFFRTEVVNPDFAVASASPMASLPRFGSMKMSASSVTIMNRFTANRAVTFTFSPKLRPAQLADRALSLAWVSGPLRLVAQYNSYVKPKYQLKFAAPATSFPMTVPHTQIAVEVVENQNVKLKSQTGSEDRKQIVFTTTATGVQKFKYDIVYKSGVYPDVRVRHEAELHPPTFTLTDLSGRELMDTVRIMSRWRYPGLLWNPDGSRIDPDLTVQMWAEYTYTQGAGVNLKYYHDSRFELDVSPEPGRQRMVDTINIKVMKDGTALRNMTIIATDSLGMYARMVPGGWRHTFYSFDYGKETRDVLQFNADGTGRLVSRVDVATGAQVDMPEEYRVLGWKVWLDHHPVTFEPTFELEWTFERPYRYGYSMYLVYGQTSYTSQGMGGRSTLVKLQ